MPSSPPEPLDNNVERGVDNLVTRCLCVRRNECVRLVTWQVPDLAEAVAAAIERVGGVVVRIPLEPLANEPESPSLDARLQAMFEGSTASVFIGAVGIGGFISVGVLRGAHRSGNRHIHMPRTDRRIFATSARADPDILSTINQRLSALIQPPSRVRVTSDAGTMLDVSLSTNHPLVAANGRPAVDEVDNLPSGFVFTHPTQVSGVMVVDRGTVSPYVQLAAGALRRAPAQITIDGGRVTRIECSDASTREALEGFMAKHPDASRVGMVTFPTNYLVRSEIGLDIQDALLPGMSLSLGYTAAAMTRARYEVPFQLRLLARKLNVEARGERVVTGGRLDDALVAGIDPFRSRVSSWPPKN